MANHAVEKFPKLITELIALEITLRAEHAIFYKTTYPIPDFKMREKNRTHEHYITVLEGILERFTTFSLEQPSSSVSTTQPNSSTPTDERISETAAISDEPTEAENAFRDAEIPADEIPMSERPLSDFRPLTEDGEEWDDDAPFQICLITASSVTSQAAELAREMEADLSRTLGESILYLNYRKVLNHAVNLPQNTAHEALWKIIQEQYDPHIADTFMANTWIPPQKYMTEK
ncbi:hypothetical protein BDV98DRAFT_595224 [Pterulicium gracile]|uniref:DUF6604 domain-containing protein n=1 Tax=Pterulicium gracile TaxID=1884261 RepID=A0A5C3QBU1_9AGAR|nr:hypothetical protein BDV98DRAFT_595224 [Pterula gracilis]